MNDLRIVNSLPDRWTTEPCPPGYRHFKRIRDDKSIFRGFLRFPHNRSRSIAGPLRYMVREPWVLQRLPECVRLHLGDRHWTAGIMARTLNALAFALPPDERFWERVRRMVRESPIAAELDNDIRLLLWADKYWDAEKTAKVLTTFALAFLSEVRAFE